MMELNDENALQESSFGCYISLYRLCAYQSYEEPTLMKYLLAILRIGNDVQQKGWYTSKTIWFNIISLVAALAALKGFNLNAEDILTLAAGISTVGNIFLRSVTDTPIGTKTVPNELPTVDKTIDNPTTNTSKPFDTGTIMG